MRVQFDELHIDLLADWTDITGDLPAGAPSTLARPTGVGALQFSATRYSGGKHPHVSLPDLQEMLDRYCDGQSRNFGEHTVIDGDIEKVGCVSFEGGETLGVWMLSNGRDVVLMTYLAIGTHDPTVSRELAEVKMMIQTIGF